MPTTDTPNTPGGFTPEPRRLMTVAQTASALTTTESHVRKLLDRRDLPTVKVGGAVRIWSTDLAEWLDANTRPALPRGGAR